ncbi:MAG: PIN domain-containing protein [Acidobacteria bacterium]|nr:PIN domain-containing protein [Acidobacteriota bacterium]MYJ03402.1 PIN domain-containing protein [Acidobacteriota bacterium]
MRSVFADTVYWIATVMPSDQWRAAARDARRCLGPVELVTTDEVLTEFLAALSKGGPRIRLAATQTVRAMLSGSNVRVIPQSRESFTKALDRYEARGDKGYSLQDCVSMNVMEAESITQVLTNDRHFEQEGFTVLMKQDAAREPLDS